MTTVALRDATNETQLHVPTSLAVWAQEARDAANVAVSLAKTPFVPASLRDRTDQSVTVANITAAILTGQELGLEPMAALRSIDVIQGTPALRAVALRAVVLSAGHDLWLVESTNTRAIVRGRRRGSDHTQESIWTMDRAKALGIAGKDNWRKQQGAMLVARATSECARLVAADALLGVPYSVEELDDGLDAVEPTTVAAGTPKRTAQRRTGQATAVARPPVQVEERAAEPEPDFDEPTAVAEPEPAPDPTAADVPMITDAQMRKMQAGFRELNLTDRGDRIAFTAEFIGRDLDSSKDLTKDEATALIDEIERRAQNRGEGEQS